MWRARSNALGTEGKEALRVLATIWQIRADLQQRFPEASSGRYDGLIDWAQGVVQKQSDSSYSALAPHALWYTKYRGNTIFPNPEELNPQHDIQAGDFRDAYRRHVRNLLSIYDTEQAIRLAIGGNYAALGTLERELLISRGLQESDYLIDVGCGSGRLAAALNGFLRGRYLGIDVVPELLDYAKTKCPADWRFELSEDLTIPEQSHTADMVCFFSVFTHLLHEQSYRYLAEATRVLRPGGKIVFSFLEFAVDSSWPIFLSSVETANPTHLNVFMSRDAIETWARHLGLKIELLQPGNEPFIPLSQPVVFDDGSRQDERGSLGQSVAVLCSPRK